MMKFGIYVIQEGKFKMARQKKLRKTWFTADLHFNHDADFIYGPRGFRSVQEMNKKIVENINSAVSAEDDLYILGDLCLGGVSNKLFAENRALIESINARLHIVYGNHDTERRKKMFAECQNVVEICGYATVFKRGKHRFYLSHYPTLTSNYDDGDGLSKKTINLCGHSHTDNKFEDIEKGVIYHVELDAHNNMPVSLEEIIEDLKLFLLDRK